MRAIAYPETALDLSTEVSRLKSLKPDTMAPITRATTAILLLEELAKQRVEMMAVFSPGTPGLFEAGQIAQLKERIEYVLDCVPWPNFTNPRTATLAEEYTRRSGGKHLDTNSGYSYEAIKIIADALERARSRESDIVVNAIKRTSISDPLMVSAGPIVFNEVGDNPNAATAVIQILAQKPVVVWPSDAAAQKYVFPKPRR